MTCPAPLESREVKAYVEKLVNGKPLSITGPFASSTEASLFIGHAYYEEDRHAAATQHLPSYRNVRYRIVYRTEEEANQKHSDNTS